MAERLVLTDIPPDFELAATSDWHLGARTHHDAALDHLIEWVLAEPHRYMGFGGDMIEGKAVASKHFDPNTLRPDLITIEQQIDRAVERLRHVAHRILYLGYGNHDIALIRDIDVVRILCERLGVEHRRGGYQTWVDVGALRMFIFHGRRSMPKGAKDPIQREANQRAWLVNELAPLAGDRHVMLMGHVHALLIQPPIEQYQLLDGPDGIRARYFVQTESPVVTRGAGGVTDTRVMVPRESRWYGCTGTLRRSGGFNFLDYAEIAGYPPSPIGWLQIGVCGGKIRGIDKVVM